MYYVYVLKSREFKKSYVGITNDIQRRIYQHNNGKSFYTKRYSPWILLYKENFTNRIAARVRERYFKSAAGRRWLRKNLFKN